MPKLFNINTKQQQVNMQFLLVKNIQIKKISNENALALIVLLYKTNLYRMVFIPTIKLCLNPTSMSIVKHKVD
jgi:hypothetical protein